MATPQATGPRSAPALRWSIANGATVWIRWTDVDVTGADDGLAVDDFSLTPLGTGAPSGSGIGQPESGRRGKLHTPDGKHHTGSESCIHEYCGGLQPDRDRRQRFLRPAE